MLEIQSTFQGYTHSFLEATMLTVLALGEMDCRIWESMCDLNYYDNFCMSTLILNLQMVVLLICNC